MNERMNTGLVNFGQEHRTGSGRVPVFASVVAISIAIFVIIYFVLTSYFLRSEERLTPLRAQFFASSIDQALTRLEHLPYVLSIDPTVLDALVAKNADHLNPILAETAQRARAEFVYVLDGSGLTIASSNFQDADSLVGNHYTFRPYFRDAIAGNQGRFYGVGVTTGRPGYFVAEPVRGDDGKIFGVVVVKIGFDDLRRALSGSGEFIMVANNQTVVLASSNPDVIYGFMQPISANEFRTLEDQQQFGGETLFPLDWVPLRDGRASLDGTAFLWAQAPLTEEDWTLHLITQISDIRLQALFYVALGFMGFLSLIVAAAIYRAARLREALAISNADRRRLAAEIEERELTEQKLEIVRFELARKNQLAALGHLSASITHELGQPISAMRNYLAAEEIATGAPPSGIWPELSGLVERMQRILNQLRLFGRKSTTELTRFNVQETLRASQKIMQHTAQASGVALELDMPAVPCFLDGQPDRFEQVVVNLLRNGIDAAGDQTGGQVRLSLQEDADTLTMRVSDNGPGLGDLDITQLREPFFSTKPSGKGMGLGLAISAQIVEEMGGVLQAENNPEQGAVFSVSFPKDTGEDG